MGRRGRGERWGGQGKGINDAELTFMLIIKV